MKTSYVDPVGYTREASSVMNSQKNAEIEGGVAKVVTRVGMQQIPTLPLASWRFRVTDHWQSLLMPDVACTNSAQILMAGYPALLY